ncbi:hypothetical protein AAFF_G00000590 [Aldrovandia affinis]|uniref:Uncharacterized protein n=1 Tax=Aldrovandia affinis TaxID=143900 RepID=A0AAD7X349_9TELE|nr:hypothetical protein AAFF_G00000590 [Aldrovandia affinis]
MLPGGSECWLLAECWHELRHESSSSTPGRAVVAGERSGALCFLETIVLRLGEVRRLIVSLSACIATQEVEQEESASHVPLGSLAHQRGVERVTASLEPVFLQPRERCARDQTVSRDAGGREGRLELARAICFAPARTREGGGK